jgi:predicted GNAT family acetyltransferase
MTIQIRRHVGAAEWLRAALPLLLQEEAENNLILGLGMTASEAPEKFPRGVNVWTVEEDGRIVAAALNTPPHNLVLTRCSAGVLDAVATALHESGERFPGVIGPDETPGEFARRWQVLTGVPVRLRMEQRIHECRAVEQLPSAPGHARPAHADDAATLERWWLAFNVDVGMPHQLEEAAPAVRGMIERNETLIWEEGGRPVSCAKWSRRTPHGVAIALVYTPPEERGKGYATSCVDELTRQQLQSGCDFCCLYTDLANPTSNAIYARIGYRRVCESAWWELGEENR